MENGVDEIIPERTPNARSLILSDMDLQSRFLDDVAQDGMRAEEKFDAAIFFKGGRKHLRNRMCRSMCRTLSKCAARMVEQWGEEWGKQTDKRAG